MPVVGTYPIHALIRAHVLEGLSRGMGNEGTVAYFWRAAAQNGTAGGLCHAMIARSTLARTCLLSSKFSCDRQMIPPNKHLTGGTGSLQSDRLWRLQTNLFSHTAVPGPGAQRTMLGPPPPKNFFAAPGPRGPQVLSNWPTSPEMFRDGKPRMTSRPIRAGGVKRNRCEFFDIEREINGMDR